LRNVEALLSHCQDVLTQPSDGGPEKQLDIISLADIDAEMQKHDAIRKASVAKEPSPVEDDCVLVAQPLAENPPPPSPAPEPSALDRLLLIFPDALPSHVEQLLREQLDLCEPSASQDWDRAVQGCAQQLLEGRYPRKALPQAPEPLPTPPPVDFSSEQHLSTASSPGYLQQTQRLLQLHFPFLRVPGLHRLLGLQGRGHYCPSLAALETQLKVPAFFGDAPPDLLQEVLRDSGGPQGDDQLLLARLLRPGPPSTDLLQASVAPLGLQLKTACKPSWSLRDVTDPLLRRELVWVLAGKLRTARADHIKQQEELVQQRAEAEGNLIECGCCCAALAFERLVQCSDGHLFCKDCLQRYAEQTLFGDGRSSLRCMDSSGSEPCGGRFSEDTLASVLSPQVFQQYQEALARDALQAAQLALVGCHGCGLQVLMDEDAGSVLRCLRCSRETCRQCGEPAHIPLRCSEVEKKGQTDRRLLLEEAMTRARVRECPAPACKTRFYKTEGCNKMACSCGVLSCYLCRQDISKAGYAHFCQTAHCTHATCGKCRLFTKTEEDDRLAMLEAGIKTLADIQLVTGKGPDQGSEEDLKQVERLLEGGLPKPATLTVQQPAPHMTLHMQQVQHLRQLQLQQAQLLQQQVQQRLQAQQQQPQVQHLQPQVQAQHLQPQVQVQHLQPQQMPAALQQLQLLRQRQVDQAQLEDRVWNRRKRKL